MRYVSLLAFALVLASCATGRDFSRPSSDSLLLGETTKSEIFAKYGDPNKQGSEIINGKSIETINYAYSGPEEPLTFGVTPARSLSLSFYNDTLVGYSFLSSFKSDHTNFDESRVEHLEKGSNCKKITEVFGPPPTKQTYPITKEQGAVVYGYGYPRTKTGLFSADFYLKQLSVECDASGRIMEISYSEIGER